MTHARAHTVHTRATAHCKPHARAAPPRTANRQLVPTAPAHARAQRHASTNAQFAHARARPTHPILPK